MEFKFISFVSFQTRQRSTEDRTVCFEMSNLLSQMGFLYKLHVMMILVTFLDHKSQMHTSEIRTACSQLCSQNQHTANVLMGLKMPQLHIINIIITATVQSV